MNRQEAYTALVAKRKSCGLCTFSGLTNPASFDGLDSDQIGPWSCWQGNLNAKIMVVGQDWGDVEYFKACKGDDKFSGNPTEANLRELLETFGILIEEYGKEQEQVVFLTNMILCLKDGFRDTTQSHRGLSAPIENAWLSNCSENFFRPLVEIIQPKIIIALGERVSKTILDLYGLPYSKSAPLSQLMNGSPFKLTESTFFFPMYHCGSGGVNRNRPMEKQEEDWGKAAEWFRASSV